MRRMGTHPGCVASSLKPIGCIGCLIHQGSIDATHLALRSHAAHGNEERGKVNDIELLFVNILMSFHLVPVRRMGTR